MNIRLSLLFSDSFFIFIILLYFPCFFFSPFVLSLISSKYSPVSYIFVSFLSFTLNILFASSRSSFYYIFHFPFSSLYLHFLQFYLDCFFLVPFIHTVFCLCIHVYVLFSPFFLPFVSYFFFVFSCSSFASSRVTSLLPLTLPFLASHISTGIVIFCFSL